MQKFVILPKKMSSLELLEHFAAGCFNAGKEHMAPMTATDNCFNLPVKSPRKFHLTTSNRSKTIKMCG